jgi:hypothetical protein
MVQRASEQPVQVILSPPARKRIFLLVVLCLPRNRCSIHYGKHTSLYRTSKRSTHSHFLISIHRTLFSTLVFTISSPASLSTEIMAARSLQLLPLSMVKKNSKNKRVTRTKKLTLSRIRMLRLNHSRSIGKPLDKLHPRYPISLPLS